MGPKDLIAQAEAALRAGKLGEAATVGRKAAVAVMDSYGIWSREAAQFALAGADADVHVWIDSDRQIAQRQDDREAVVHLSRVAPSKVGFAATAALRSADPDAASTFLRTGVIEASAVDNRVAVVRLLADKPGRAVTEAANAALNAGTPQALQAFLSGAFERAQREDDAVAIASLLRTAGPYTKAHAQAVLEGPSWLRRRFVASIQYETAQLDHDFLAHVAAMQGAIAAGAKSADKAQEDAARAQEAAAKARNAAAEAVTWAGKAEAAKARAATSAQQASAYADQAEASARNAQASAATAKQQAASARSAARAANFSANKAMESARDARSYADRAKQSAAEARDFALAAGKSEEEAAGLAHLARADATVKREAENRAAAEAAAQQTAAAEASGKSPSESPEHDTMRLGVSTKTWKEWSDSWHEQAFWYGTAAVAALGVSAFFPPALVLAGALSITTVILDVGSAVFAGLGYGLTSHEFFTRAGMGALSTASFGLAGTFAKIPGVSHVAGELTKGAFDAWGSFVNRLTGH